MTVSYDTLKISLRKTVR